MLNTMQELLVHRKQRHVKLGFQYEDASSNANNTAPTGVPKAVASPATRAAYKAKAVVDMT
jgi:hypothetical protein